MTDVRRKLANSLPGKVQAIRLRTLKSNYIEENYETRAGKNRRRQRLMKTIRDRGDGRHREAVLVVCPLGSEDREGNWEYQIVRSNAVKTAFIKENPENPEIECVRIQRISGENFFWATLKGWVHDGIPDDSLELGHALVNFFIVKKKWSTGELIERASLELDMNKNTVENIVQICLFAHELFGLEEGTFKLSLQSQTGYATVRGLHRSIGRSSKTRIRELASVISNAKDSLDGHLISSTLAKIQIFFGLLKRNQMINSFRMETLDLVRISDEPEKMDQIIAFLKGKEPIDPPPAKIETFSMEDVQIECETHVQGDAPPLKIGSAITNLANRIASGSRRLLSGRISNITKIWPF